MINEKKIAIVIPAHDEEKLIKPTILGVPKYVDKIIVIDDGSKDKTYDTICGIQDARIEVIKHKVNKGLGSALVSGYTKTLEENFDIVITVGGDNQMDLKELPLFIAPIMKDEADYVKGNRFLNESWKKMPLARLFGNTFLSAIEKFATGYWRVFDTHDGYTVMNKKALKAVNWEELWTGYGYNADILCRLNIAGLRVKDVSRTAIYLKGARQTQIRTALYIGMVIPLIIKMYIWRIKNKYFKK